MAQIVLSTINARFSHTAVALRLLRANLQELHDDSEIIEFTLQSTPLDIAEAILERDPKILALSVYIWNITPLTQLVEILKKVAPTIYIVIGGPEVSWADDSLPIVALADILVRGEGEGVFPSICRQLLAGDSLPAIIDAEPLPLTQIRHPYDELSDADIRHRVIYFELSRGCPQHCAFCLSALDKGLRQHPIEASLRHFDTLLERGVRNFKLLDRSVNLLRNEGRRFLEHAAQRQAQGYPISLHLEWVPELASDAWIQLLARFDPASVQLEIGIQTLNPAVAELISRPLHFERINTALKRLLSETGVHIHADLIVGLPGESLESFAAGFDQLVHTGVHEVQVGILKKLRGAPIAALDEPYAMCYGSLPPYEILQNSTLSFSQIQALNRFAKLWNTVVNSGNFRHCSRVILGDAPFASFNRFTLFFINQNSHVHGVSLKKVQHTVFNFLVHERAHQAQEVAEWLLEDIVAAGRHELPHFLERWIEASRRPQRRSTRRRKGRERQTRFKQDLELPAQELPIDHPAP